MDLLAVGAEGELIAVRMAEADDDLAMLARLLADLSWLRPRRQDDLKLATSNGIDPSAEPRGLLVSASMGRETRAAVDNFPADPVQLWLARPGRAADRFHLHGAPRLHPVLRPVGHCDRMDGPGRPGRSTAHRPPEPVGVPNGPLRE